MKETHGVGVNSGNISNSTFVKTIINDTKNFPRKGEPAEFPNNLNILQTGAVKFVGRDKDIKHLHEQLQAKERVSITAVVTGMAGIGKTELALQYSLLSEKDLNYPGGICWINVRERSVGEQLLSFAKTQLGLFPTEDWSLEEKLRFCWSNWQPPGDVLIVLDDVNKYEEIEQYLPPPKQRFKLLITTRKRWLTQSFQRLDLKVLDEDAALNLLICYVGSDRIKDELEEAKILCKSLGFLPWGLELVGRYLERKPNLSLAKTRKRLGLEHSSLQEYSRNMNAKRGVAAAFELSWEELDEDDKKLGCLLSLFASARIPWDLVEGCFPEVSEEKLENRRDYKLVNLNLLQSLGKNCYELHPLIREFFRNKLSGLDFVEEIKRNICRVIVDAAKEIDNKDYLLITVEQVKKVEHYIPHIIEIAENLSECLSDDDLIVPFTRLGTFYGSQELYSLTQFWLEKGKEVAEKRLDKNNSYIATIYLELANLYSKQGKDEAAEPLYLQAIEIHKIVFGENHEFLAIHLNNLANLYSKQGKDEAAEPLYLQAIEISKIASGENNAILPVLLSNLAECYCIQGKYGAAEPLYLQAIEISKIALHENSPQLALLLNNLATLYLEQGKYEAAEPLYLQAIEIDKIALHENSPQLARHLNNLAILYRGQGKYDAAEPLYLQALEIHKIALHE
ncbi:MAG: tetratricopeptide repeat protein, partial [Trichodesmium sp. St7_bin2_1]|nr:tetratricopeptide repeat protein [Trichodesmium sp. St7_bin2_1]